MMMTIENKRVFIVLILIIIGGGVLRFHKLGSKEFAATEIITANALADYSLIDMVESRLKSGHTPFYYLLTRILSNLFHINEITLRFFSALAGTFSIFVIFYIGKVLWGNLPSLIASFFFALSPFNLFFSQLARPQSIALFFSLLSVYFFLLAVGENSNRSWDKYIFFTTVSLYTYNPSCLIILTQALYIFFFCPKCQNTVKKFVLSIGIIILFYLPLLIPIITSGDNIEKLLGWRPLPGFLTIYNFFSRDLNYFPQYPCIKLMGKRIFLCFFLFLTGCVISLLKIRANVLFFRLDNTKIIIKPYIFLLLWLTIPVISLYVVSHLVIPVFSTWYLLIVEVAYLFFVAIAISFIKNVVNLLHSRWIRTAGFCLLFIALIILVFIQFTYSTEYYLSRNPEIKKAMAYLSEKAQKTDKVMFRPNLLRFYYYGSETYVLRVDSSILLEEDRKLFLLNLLNKNCDCDYTSKLAEYFTILEEKKFFKVTVYCLKKLADKSSFLNMRQILECKK